MRTLIVSRTLRAIALLLLIVSSASANTLDLIVEPPYTAPKLSPDGAYMAVIGKDDKGIKALCVVNISEKKSEHYYARNSKKERANTLSFRWVSDDTIVATSDAYSDAEALHTVTIGDRVMGTLETEGKYTIVDPMPHTTRYIVAHRPEKDAWGECTIEERDAADQQYKNVLYRCTSKVFECVTDSDHELRVLKKNQGENQDPAWYWYNGLDWKLTKLSPWIRVHGLKYGQNHIGFIAGWMNESRPALYFYDFQEDSVTGKLLDYPVYAIDRFAEPLSQGHPNAILGYYLDVDLPRDVWLSKKMNEFQALVDKLLPGSRNLIRDWSKTHEHLLVERTMLDSPSHLVWVNTKTQQSQLLLINGGQIEGVDVGRSSVVQVKNRHGIDLTAILTIPHVNTLKNMPLVVYIRSDPWGDLDRYGWCSEAEYMAAKGLVVLRMNVRGSKGMYGDHALDLKTVQGLNGFFEDIDDGITEILKTGIIDPDRIGIAGTGRGAWVAACAPTVCQTDFKAVVAMNGVYDLLNYRAKADDIDSMKSMILMPFALPDSGLSDSELRRFSPEQNLENYAESLFLSIGNWSNKGFLDQIRSFRSEAGRYGVTVRFYSADWWGNMMNLEQRVRAWRDGVDLLLDELTKD